MRKKKRRKTLRWLFLLMGIFLVLFLAGCTAMLSVGSSLMDKGKVQNQIGSSIIYDNKGNEIYKLFIENREYIGYTQIPDMLVKAFVNTEDERFFSHKGVDIIGIGRALYKDIVAGGAVQGASTITQQLAKNVYLSSDKTIWRKTKEALIALNLERNYSKEQILEFYLNEIYFGHGTYGIQAASKYYFGKDVSQLDLSEMAMLAGMPKAPNSYSPYEHYDKAIERRNTVLSLMEKYHTITPEQREAASKEKLKLAPHGNEKKGIQAYVDYVLQEAETKYGLTENQLYRGGYKIYTEMDPKVQGALTAAFNNPDLFPKSASKDQVEAGMVITNPKTGGIVAMMGGRNYVTKGFNHALAKRSPGSTFKPLAVYAPALEKGWKPYDMIKDQKTTYPGGYTPTNYNGRYLGEVSMYDALKESMNAPAVWLLNEIGIDTSLRYLDRFGIPYDKKSDRQLGIALGGLTNGVSTIDMARGYSAFANHGVVTDPHVIAEIKNPDGSDIKADISTSTVISEQTAYYMTKMLQAVINEGTGTSARMSRPVAGKTGTTEMEGTNHRGNRDAWFVGYTPEYLGAIWMGYDRSNSTTNYLRQGSAVTANFFKRVMLEAERGVPVKPFPTPSGVEPLQRHTEEAVHNIQDLKLEQTGDSIHLTWTNNEESAGMMFHVYRYFDDSSQKELIAETSSPEWVDQGLPTDQTVHYFVVPYDPNTQREGSPSNIVEIKPVETQNPELLPPDNGSEDQQGTDPNQPGQSTDQPGDQQQGDSSQNPQQDQNPDQQGNPADSQDPTQTQNGDGSSVDNPLIAPPATDSTQSGEQLVPQGPGHGKKKHERP